MEIQKKIKEAQTLEQLTNVIENAENKQPNGEKTQFSRHLDDVLWYTDLDLKGQKKLAIKICKAYNKQ